MPQRVVWSARARATAISSVCRSVGGRSRASASQVPAGRGRAHPASGAVVGVRYLAPVADAGPSGKWFAATPFKSQPARMRIDTVQRRDWREYREIRLAALKDAPSAFASTWQEEASLTASQWMERAQRS